MKNKSTLEKISLFMKKSIAYKEDISSSFYVFSLSNFLFFIKGTFVFSLSNIMDYECYAAIIFYCFPHIFLYTFISNVVLH